MVSHTDEGYPNIPAIAEIMQRFSAELKAIIEFDEIILLDNLGRKISFHEHGIRVEGYRK